MNFRPTMVLLIVLLVASTVSAQSPRAVSVDDLFGMQEVNDPQISPDGQFVAYVVSSTNLKEDRGQQRIWMVRASGGDAIPLTAEENSSSQPRWSPDGKYLAFLSERNEGKTQVYLLNRLGGEAQNLTDTPQDVDTYEWSPDSQRLVLILRDASLEELEAAASKGRGDADDKGAAVHKRKSQPPWVIDRLQFKEDTVGYLDHRRTHLYTLDIATKALNQVSSGDYDDMEPAWSPDGRLLAFASNRSKEPDTNYESNIWVVSADNRDQGANRKQVTTNSGDDHHPAWSPDGKSIAYTAIIDPKLFWYATTHVAVSPAGGGETWVLTKAFDRMATVPHFAPDGQSIYFIADDDGAQILARVKIADGQIDRPMSGRFMLQDYSVSKDGSLAASISTMGRPFEAYLAPGGKLTQLSHVNDAWLGKFTWSEGEYVSFPSKDGTTVHGYVYKPVDYVPGKKYPTILRPHGGPVWAYYAEFQDLAQLLAANGYVVLLPNPRGSTGYGQDYCKAIFGAWGAKDFEDDMALVDYAIRAGYSDPEKLGVNGWSYGGISTDFIITQTTRFKGAISGAGAADHLSLWGHDQYQREFVHELGIPWETPENWNRVNYLKRVTNVTTPTMFVGGNIDWNVPILGGEQMYLSLKKLGRETLLVVYPDEYHEFKTPSHIKDRNERYLAWYAHYVKADGTPARPPEKPVATKAAN